MANLTSRQSWMATLAKTASHQLEQAVAPLAPLPCYEFLRPPETGLTLIQGRTGGTGQPFYLGEMTLTRCVVKLCPDSEIAILGFGYVAGRSHRHAELAALCDALLQHPDWHDVIHTQVILPLQVARHQQQQQQQRQTEATRVNFLTLVRGS